MTERIEIENLTLKQIRRLHGITMEEISKKINITKQGYFYKESGKRKFKKKELEKIAKIFNLKIEVIFKIIKNSNINIYENKEM